MHTGISIGIGPVFPSKTQSARDSLDGESQYRTTPHALTTSEYRTILELS
ncbi:hypothetical protein BofuT4_P098650.1 [Botrytis cinerea T4]|uniref:Uncharacterized protein n=1 Tax=Botryotinia fuckeliana (strain T4) TaxID=999810 RepID=G2YCH7_BOTF4|nr:hypothetical protein BofuT4_P098650.1 [Botrytis cinerea T4]